LIGTGEWAALGTAMAWTLSALAWTAAGKRIGALATSFIRLIMATLLLAIYGRLMRGLWLPSDASRDTWLYLSLSGFFGFFLADLLVFRALVLIGPRLALLIQSLSPPMAALLAWMFLGERLSGLDLAGMVLTLAGISWVILGRTAPATSYIDRGDLRRGLILSIAGCLAQAIGYIFSKQGIGQYDAVAGTFIRVLAGTAGFLVLITLARRWSAMWVAARQPQAMAIVAYGSLVGPFVGVALSLEAIRLCPTGVAATLIGTTPVLVLPFAVAFYRERLTAQAVGGAILSVLGVALLVL
jgi:drug/metabolite transporter (DMT)-like permease